MVSKRQMNFMCRRPQALLKYQLTGRTPRETKSPEIPLRTLIESIPRSERQRYRNINICPELGLNLKTSFHSLMHLWLWLGGGKTLIETERMPYQSYVNPQCKKVTVKQLRKHSHYR